MTERDIQEAVVRADVLLDKLIRAAAVLAMLAVLAGLVLIAALAARHFSRAGPASIDDVTSKWPEEDNAPAGYEWEDEDL